MYFDFYRLKENPFNVTADPDFFYYSKSHAEAMSMIAYGIDQRKGILLLTGEIGTGKTTLCRKLLRHTDGKTKFALILNPNFSEVDLLKLIIHDLGIIVKKPVNKFILINALNEYLISESIKGNNVVLMIDEAQNLSTTQLEQIRLLSNLETEKEKLLQILLVGQPELLEKLQSTSLRQLRQRIAINFHIEPLPKSDVKQYIVDRINKVTDHPDKETVLSFTDSAIEAIYHYTKGTPRTINVLCDRALLAGFGSETFSIDETIIQNCAKEVLYCEHYI